MYIFTKIRLLILKWNSTVIFLFSSSCSLSTLLTPGEMGGQLEGIRHYPREGAADAQRLREKGQEKHPRISCSFFMCSRNMY